jgi:hypothetical protein
VGRALVRRCVDEAAALGAGLLYLYTTEDMGVLDWYRGQGWFVHDRLTLGGVQALVMATRTRVAMERRA